MQIIPAYDALTEEAVREAVENKWARPRTRVMRVEHLIAIALKTGRAKDYARIALLFEDTQTDDARLREILIRHNLQEKWNQYRLRS